MPSGWQNGISSCVRFAAIVPATIAVWKIGPLAVAKPCDCRARNASSGKRTLVSARATRIVGVFALTSTIAGAPAAPTWESFPASSANVVHLDLARPRLARGAFAQLAVTVLALPPHRANALAQRRNFCALAQHRAQVRAGRGEQASVKDSVRGQSCARASAAERLGDRGDEPDLAATVDEGV